MFTTDSDDFEAFLDTGSGPLLFKSLAPNDHRWADPKGPHQAGVLVPREYFRFFGYDDHPTRNAAIDVVIDWFFGGKIVRKEASARYYCEGNRAARPELHLTRLVRPAFQEIADGSLLVVRRQGERSFAAIVIDCANEDLIAEARDLLGLGEATWGTVGFEDLPEENEWLEAIKAVALELYGTGVALPKTVDTARAARELATSFPARVRDDIVLPRHAQDPMAAAFKNVPGNLARWLLQTVEYAVVREVERLHYPKVFIRAIRGESITEDTTWPDVQESCGRNLEDVIDVGKSVTASRRSRAGKSFEHHVGAILEQAGLEFERQSGKERLDFLVHPNTCPVRVSAKTSLRERWKQVPEETFFVTLDPNISAEKVERLAARRITLVVPEDDFRARHQFANQERVLSFKHFIQRLQRQS